MKRLTKFMVIGVLAIAFLSFSPHKAPSTRNGRLYCYVYLVLENKDRHCYGYVYEECGEWEGPIYHDPPWGNWGVDSNLGGRFDGHQFQGWKHEDNLYQWNSCTHPYKKWAPPTPCDGASSYYNDKQTAEGCWEQKTFWGAEINTYAVKEIRWGVDPSVG